MEEISHTGMNSFNSLSVLAFFKMYVIQILRQTLCWNEIEVESLKKIIYKTQRHEQITRTNTKSSSIPLIKHLLICPKVVVNLAWFNRLVNIICMQYYGRTFFRCDKTSSFKIKINTIYLPLLGTFPNDWICSSSLLFTSFDHLTLPNFHHGYRTA
jgi:hypothetical protein